MFRLAVVGCGRVFSRYHLRALRARSDVRIVGAVETDADRLEWARGELSGAECGTDLVTLLDRVEVDGVLIATPPPAHADAAVACLERRLPVLVEKPMAATLFDAQRIVDAQDRSRTPLIVGFNRRFYGAYRALGPRVATTLPELEIEYRFIAEQDRWGTGSPVRDPARVLDDIGCHALDLLSFLTGSPVRELRASALN
ncbi:MAG: Gfo/Idh/MocA family oxidoreductase, partial [Gemmatimonadetes bacterium]|nr:Gfo/Idh/MocA family oxidoreductase [Gemmatimonadota bacterium]